jgi:hypothetical protein
MASGTTIILSLVASIILVSCSGQVEKQVPVNARIIAKYRLLDEYMSPEITKCGNDIRKEFLESGRYECAFKLSGLEFIIEKKYIVDRLGELKEYWPYHAEGPEILTRKELARDSSFARSEGLNGFYLSLVNRSAVVDGRDTVAITRVFPKEKLIFTTRSARDSADGRRIIYQYQL